MLREVLAEDELEKKTNYAHSTKAFIDEQFKITEDTLQLIEDNNWQPDFEAAIAENKKLDLARSYGVTVVDPEETDQTLKAFGKAAIESIPGISTAATIRDIKEELQEEDPSWGKIGLLTAGEAVGMIPGLGDAGDLAFGEKLQ